MWVIDIVKIDKDCKKFIIKFKKNYQNRCDLVPGQFLSDFFDTINDLVVGNEFRSTECLAHDHITTCVIGY